MGQVRLAIISGMVVQVLSRLIHDLCDIGLSGEPELGVHQTIPSLLSEQYDYIDRIQANPWPKPESIGEQFHQGSCLELHPGCAPSQERNSCMGKGVRRLLLSL